MRAQKLRTFLTLLGVVAGVATVIMMVSFVAGFDRSVTTGVLAVRHPPRAVPEVRAALRRRPGDAPEEERNRRDLTLEDAAALKRLATLAAAVSPERYFGSGRPRCAPPARSPTARCMVGATPDYAEANNALRRRTAAS